MLNGLNEMRGGVDLVLSRLLESYGPGEMAGRSHLLRKGTICNDRHAHKRDYKPGVLCRNYKQVNCKRKK